MRLLLSFCLSWVINKTYAPLSQLGLSSPPFVSNLAYGQQASDAYALDLQLRGLLPSVNTIEN
jgi:hypothetical protein